MSLSILSAEVMQTISTGIPDLLIVEPQVFGDRRGFFMESYNSRRYREAGLPTRFCQDNVSSSRRGVLRGLHFQQPNAQGKLVHVLQGEVFDVAVDLRRGSPTFGEWFGVYLSGENKRQLYVPEGFAHGFCVTSESAVFAYKCTAHYDPACEQSIRWDDPRIGIEWPLADPILSEKDLKGWTLDAFPEGGFPVYRPTRERLFVPQQPQPASDRRRALVIGATGQVGRELCRSLQYQFEIVPAGRQIKDGVQIDLSDTKSIRNAIRQECPQLIFNAGAYTDVDSAEQEPDLALAVNGHAVRTLAEEAERIGAAIIHYSTDYVFDGDGDRPWTEGDRPLPQNQYGTSKHAGDVALRESGVPFLNLRISWVYGPHGKNFVKSILRLAQSRRQLSIVSDQIGAPTSARVIGDMTAQILAGGPGDPVGYLQDNGGEYHLQCQGEASWHDFAIEIVRLAREDTWPVMTQSIRAIPTTDYPTPARRPLNSRLNCTKLTEKFGLAPPNWRQALKQSFPMVLESTFRENSASEKQATRWVA